MLKNIKFNQTA